MAATKPSPAMPAQVIIAVEEQQPVPVVIEASTPAPAITVTKGGGTTLAPTTTEAQDKTTEGQRRINLIWESVQGFIAICVTATTVFVLAAMTLREQDVTANQLIAVSQLVVMATLILSFYFSRTNHQAIGGIGSKPNEPYQGR